MQCTGAVFIKVSMSRQTYYLYWSHERSLSLSAVYLMRTSVTSEGKPVRAGVRGVEE